MAHYHALAGLHGCMPTVNDVCETYEQAVDSLAETHELSIRKTRELKRDGYLKLNLHKHGNEYCEITECEEEDCTTDLE